VPLYQVHGPQSLPAMQLFTQALSAISKQHPSAQVWFLTGAAQEDDDVNTHPGPFRNTHNTLTSGPDKVGKNGSSSEE